MNLFAPFLPVFGALRFGPSGVSGFLLMLGLALAAVAVALVAYRSTQPALTPGRRAILTGARTLALLIVLFMLAEPVWNQRKDVRVPPGVLLLVDDSGSMDIADADGSTRLEQATFLRDRARGALAQSSDDAQVWMGQGARRLEVSTPAAESGGGSRRSRGEGTNLPGLLLSSAQRHLEDNLSAILLFTDGVNTAANAPSLAGLNVPVFPVAVGDTVGSADVLLDRVRYPSLAYRGERIEVSAEVVARGGSAGATWAVLSRAGAPVDSVRVQWPDGGGRQPIRFEAVADSLGLMNLMLDVLPLEGESLTENNRVQVGMEVRKERLRITMVQARPSWDFHFLSRHATRDLRFDFQGVYRNENGWRVAGTDSTWTMPQRTEDATETDLWVVGSLSDFNDVLTNGPAIVSSVEAGAGLLVLAGRANRGAVRSLPQRAREVLPLWPGSSARWLRTRFSTEAAPAGRLHPVLAASSETGSVIDRLAELPPLWAVVSPAVVAQDADLLIEGSGAGSTYPLLAFRPHGAGRVASWVGTPLWSWSFWRLGQDDSEGVFNALMGNLFYFLAEGGERTRLRLHLPRPVLAQGQEATLRALALDQRLQPDAVHDVWLEWAQAAAPDSLLEPSGRARMNLDPDTAGGRVLPLPSLPAGEYRMRVALEEDDSRITSAWQPLLVDPYSVEFLDPRVDMPALAAIAAATGGRVLSASEVGEWSASVPLQAKQAVLTGRLDLWDSPWIFMPLIALLGFEWGMRKRWGLV